MTGVVTPDNVVQFRGIPYATIPARFKQSILAQPPLDTNGDFTKHGYQCPQTYGVDTHNGGPFPGEVYPPATDEFKCLILQLNIPLRCLESTCHSSKLPVLVYIHGGGFVVGKIDEQHNTALMVEQSLFDSQPIISASFQYRLGALGYLHTPEPGNANRALNDQRNALIWIQRFIGGFGGDREKITVFGESAGSMSICAHMLSPPPASGPLFKRAILMSGIIGPTSAPASVKVAGQMYETFLAKFDIQEQGEAALNQLRELGIEKIVDATAELSDEGWMWLSVQDQEWFGKDTGIVTWDRVPELIGKCEWVDDIVLGTTSFEGTTFMARVAGVTPQAFLAGITEQLGEESAELVGQAYKITSDMDQNLFTTRALQWVGDVIFDAPNHCLAKYLTTHTNKKVYRYIFDVRNPFPCNTLYQQAHHWVDMYYVFKTFQFRYPTQKLKDISTQHARLWIDFANGKMPWREYKYTGNGDEKIIVADERDSWVERTVAEEEKILGTTWRRCEALVASWKNKMGQSFVPLDIAPLKGKKLT
ncbi:alpha/beta-hydrolase [Cucurbitaria berberidis CBS 394.84]|uniref:Carboxylic ester hydrolase n=1 Tax=Cucurbitaria berberidis CBS 394.84 TaxID=1168544 RepID=A0A9P4GUL1_9PLEO|nr:alpha/beta-hydrolase [Cucurbitaria berberidis CBS 394.84]KAF1851559.1 alpha/beta-hydrolase [Cucurbitaria berberidis CBS 394.84]